MIKIEDAKPNFHVYRGGYKTPEYGLVVGTDTKHVIVCFDGVTMQPCRPDELNWPPYFCRGDGACPPDQPYDDMR